MRVLEIFFGVNVLGVFLRFLFANAFLTGGFGDGLILLLVLRARNGGAESCEAQKQDGECSEMDGARDSPCACATRLKGPGAVEVSKLHGKPTTGGLCVRRSVSGKRWNGKGFSRPVACP